MKLTLKYPKELCIFTLYQTLPYLDLACPHPRKDPHGKVNKIFLSSPKQNVVILVNHFISKRE